LANRDVEAQEYSWFSFGLEMFNNSGHFQSATAHALSSPKKNPRRYLGLDGAGKGI
jgi:hypothetical protein